MRKKCVKCHLPKGVPGSDFDNSGICRFCREFKISDLEKREKQRKIWERELFQILSDLKNRNGYTCLVPFSGGKDSCYLLYKLIKDYGQRPLVFTLDVGLPDIAWDNISRTVKELDVEHLIYRIPQDFLKRVFSYLLKNQLTGGAVRTVDYAYAAIFESFALNLAMEKEISYIFAGYSPGQPEKSVMEFEFKRDMIVNKDWTPKEIVESGLLSKSELKIWWNPFRFNKRDIFPRYIAPLHAFPYDQDKIIADVVKWGLVKDRKYASPVFSNIDLNWLLMYSDFLNLGYNPYAPEFCNLLREGKITKLNLKFMDFMVNLLIKCRLGPGKNINKMLNWLELEPCDLRLTREMKEGDSIMYPGKK